MVDRIVRHHRPGTGDHPKPSIALAWVPAPQLRPGGDRGDQTAAIWRHQGGDHPLRSHCQLQKLALGQDVDH